MSLAARAAFAAPSGAEGPSGDDLFPVVFPVVAGLLSLLVNDLNMECLYIAR
jgi:hypothetical protein